MLGTRIKVQGKRISMLRFADNIVLLTEIKSTILLHWHSTKMKQSSWKALEIEIL